MPKDVAHFLSPGQITTITTGRIAAPVTNPSLNGKLNAAAPMSPLGGMTSPEVSKILVYAPDRHVDRVLRHCYTRAMI
ncbi:MAG TPA: hypothetical protein HPP77_07600 [Candidatus Hydrogenedentes bacterium]|nr:hypothetical protein [Candidatus Hydrogenedentota bacterium]